ncbi:MAG: hypothetical protein ACREFO_19535 [Acetobacteraceae bacterium]
MKILLCTVGGSHAPILTALNSGSWDHVEFVCTEDDPAAGKRGSVSMVRDHVEVPGRTVPPVSRLPSIPEQARLDPASWSVCLVAPDDPDGIFGKLVERLSELQSAHPDAEIVVDFTGGTKSMSVGAALAVTARPPARLQVTTGTRSDLVRVLDGTEQPIVLRTDRLVIERQIELLRAAWTRFGYAEAAAGFDLLSETLAAAAPEQLRQRLNDLHHLSAAFAAWDRFDHRHVRESLNRVKSRYPDWVAPWMVRQSELLHDSVARSHPHKICDLWLNAERRAARGRYDDAVARAYRLVEWTGQWLLGTRLGIDSGNVDLSAMDPAVLQRAGIQQRPDKRDLGGLESSLRLLAALDPGGRMDAFLNRPLDDAAGRTGLDVLTKDLLPLRNRSILAHGFDPLGEDKWNRWRAFIGDTFFSRMLLPELGAVGISGMPAQLPTAPPPDL